VIRKPGEDDFREGAAVTAIRETGKVAVEGSRGLGQGARKLMLYWFAGTMAFAFFVSFGTATGGLGFLAAPLAFGWYRKNRRAREAERMEALRLQPYQYVANSVSAGEWPFSGRDAGAALACPADVRGEARLELDIGALAQRAVAFFAIGFALMAMFRKSLDLIAYGMGGAFVVIAVLVAARMFGNRTVLEWNRREVSVQQLLTSGTIRWSDVTEITVETSSWRDLRTLFMAGSRKNIVIRALHNETGGPSKLYAPVKLMALSELEIERTVRDLHCWRVAATTAFLRQPAQRGWASQSPAGAREPDAVAIGPSSEPRASFDADAIMEGYLARRAEAFAAAGRQDAGPVSGARSVNAGRPVFGRKRAI